MAIPHFIRKSHVLAWWCLRHRNVTSSLQRTNQIRGKRLVQPSQKLHGQHDTSCFLVFPKTDYKFQSCSFWSVCVTEAEVKSPVDKSILSKEKLVGVSTPFMNSETTSLRPPWRPESGRIAKRWSIKFILSDVGRKRRAQLLTSPLGPDEYLWVAQPEPSSPATGTAWVRAVFKIETCRWKGWWNFLHNVHGSCMKGAGKIVVVVVCANSKT